MNLASISARKASRLAFSLIRPLFSIVAISSSVMSDTASPSPRRRVSWIAARALFEILPGSRASQITTWVSNRITGIAHQNCLYKIAYKSLPHSSEDRAGETTSPVTEPLPLKNPKISSVSVFTGTSFATGSPCLVITTVSRLALTSSMMARQLVLNAPAGMVFIRSLVDKALDYGHYTIVIAEFFDREGTSFTRADFGERMGGFQPLKFAFLFAGSERTYVPSPTELRERARLHR